MTISRTELEAKQQALVKALNELLENHRNQTWPVAKFMTAAEAETELNGRINATQTAEDVAIKAGVDPYKMEIKHHHFEAYNDHEVYAQTGSGQVLGLNDGAQLGYEVAGGYSGFAVQEQAQALYRQYESERLKYEKHVREAALEVLQEQPEAIAELAKAAGFRAEQAEAMSKAGADLEGYLLGNIKAAERLANKKGE